MLLLLAGIAWVSPAKCSRHTVRPWPPLGLCVALRTKTADVLPLGLKLVPVTFALEPANAVCYPADVADSPIKTALVPKCGELYDLRFSSLRSAGEHGGEVW